MIASPLAPELDELIERAAALPHGLVFLESAPPECVSYTLGVSRDVVGRVRDGLETPATRELIASAFRRAVERLAARSASATGDLAPLPGSPPPHGPAELIRAAETNPRGIQFLLCAPLETVAVSFGVHPFVVLGARELLGRRGVAPEAENGPAGEGD